MRLELVSSLSWLRDRLHQLQGYVEKPHHPMHLEKEHPNFEHLHWAPNAPLAAQSWGPPKAASQPPKIPADGHSVSKKSEAPSDTLYIYIFIYIYIYTTYNVHIGNYPSWQIWLQKIQICRSSGNLLILRRASNWPVLQLSQDNRSQTTMSSKPNDRNSITGCYQYQITQV